MKASVMIAASVLSLSLTGLAGAQTKNLKMMTSNPGHLKMGLVAIKCVYSDTADPVANKNNIQANLERHLYFIDKLAAEGCEFIGFPEASINGYHYSPNMTWLKLDGPEVGVLAKKAVEKGIYISAGIAEEDAKGKRWETQFVIGPDGKIAGWHHKNFLTKEKGLIEASTDHNVFEVKGTKMGIAICADGSNPTNLMALAEGGAKIIYGPHANTTGGTLAGWYNFRKGWSGPEGMMAKLKVYGALHNFAGLYNPEFKPPTATDSNSGFASGAWFIGPDGATLAQMPTSSQKGDSKEFVLVYNVPIGK